MNETITVRIFGREIEFGDRMDLSDSDVWVGKVDDVYIELEYRRTNDWRERGPWYVILGEDYRGGGETKEAAAADLEARLMPLARLLVGRWRDHVRHLQRVTETAGYIVGAFSNETDDAEHIKVVSELEAAWSEYESWRWTQSTPELFPEQVRVEVAVLRPSDDEPVHIASYSGIVAAHEAAQANGGELPADWLSTDGLLEPRSAEWKPSPELQPIVDANVRGLIEAGEQRDTDVSELVPEAMGGE